MIEGRQIAAGRQILRGILATFVGLERDWPSLRMLGVDELNRGAFEGGVREAVVHDTRDAARNHRRGHDVCRDAAGNRGAREQRTVTPAPSPTPRERFVHTRPPPPAAL